MLRPLIVAGVTLAVACTSSGERHAWLDEYAQHAHAAESDTVAVIVFDPDTCFACDSKLMEWAMAKRASPESVVLLLSHAPDEAAKTALTVQRIPIDQEISARRSSLGRRAPAEYLVVNGRVIAQREHAGDQERLDVIERFRNRLIGTRASAATSPQR